MFAFEGAYFCELCVDYGVAVLECVGDVIVDCEDGGCDREIGVGREEVDGEGVGDVGWSVD